jgi:hypothetical protein
MTAFHDRAVPPDHLLTRVRNEAFARLSPAQAANTHLSLVPRVYPAGHRLTLVDTTLTVEQDSILIFVDEMPGANFGHPCRYQFHSVSTGKLVQEEQALFPPVVAEPDVLVEEFHAPLRTKYARPVVYGAVDWAKAKPFPWLLDDDNRFALLFTSQISNRRHVEDIEFAWRILRHRFGFPADHIYVLCYNGTIAATDATTTQLATWVGDNTPYEMQVHASATKANLESTFTAIGQRMNSESLLFVHTNNHGSPNGLCVDNSSVVTPSEWGTMLDGLPSFGSLVVTMEQCFSGAFLQPTLDNSPAARTSFASAVPADKVSAGDSHFDPWARAWFESVNGATAYGAGLVADPDVNHNGRVSVREAFTYSKANDPASIDDPQYGDSPAGCGSAVYLAKPPTLPDIVRALVSRLVAVQGTIGPNPPDPGPEWIGELLANYIQLDSLATRAELEYGTVGVPVPEPVAVDPVEDATVLFPSAGAVAR